LVAHRAAQELTTRFEFQQVQTHLPPFALFSFASDLLPTQIFPPLKPAEYRFQGLRPALWTVNLAPQTLDGSRRALCVPNADQLKSAARVRLLSGRQERHRDAHMTVNGNSVILGKLRPTKESSF